MSELYHPSASASARAFFQNMEQYRELYEKSVTAPDAFWAEEAEKFDWFKKWDRVRDYNYNVKNGKIRIEWFKGGKTNITTNCIDRHLKDRRDQTAILWEGQRAG